MPGLSLDAKDLIRIYYSKRVRCRALRGVSLHVDPGEFVAVTGTSGSGKSTLLYLLAGLDTPTSGIVHIGSTDISSMSEDERAFFRRIHTGFIFQNFNLLKDLTVLENAALPLAVQGEEKHIREEKAAELLGRLGLEEHLLHFPDELSGGQQQRTAAARALVSEPGIVFADEPTGNLDSATADEVMDLLLKEVKDRAMTLVMVTHDPERAKQADRVVMIRDGRLAEEVQRS